MMLQLRFRNLQMVLSLILSALTSMNANVYRPKLIMPEVKPIVLVLWLSSIKSTLMSAIS